jgi:chromosome segregation ATPase
MGENSSQVAAPDRAAGARIHLELRYGSARSRLYAVPEAGFLIGTVPGCDLRLPGVDLPPVICLIGPHSDGIGMRRLVPTQPILINGQATAQANLVDGDRVTVGPAELVVHIKDLATSVGQDESTELATRAAEIEIQTRELERSQVLLDEQAKELETDRILWYTRREAMEREAKQLRAELSSLQVLREDLRLREEAVKHERNELSRQSVELDQQRLQQSQELSRLKTELEAQRVSLISQQQELETARQELSGVRQQVYDRYRERRDRLAGLEEAVRKAAANVQEQKRVLTADLKQAAQHRQEDDQHRLAVEARKLAVEQARQELDEAGQKFEEHRQQEEQRLQEHSAELQESDRQLVEERNVLDQQQAQYRADLVRLDRWASTLEERQKQQQVRAQEIDSRYADLQRDSRELETQALGILDWETQLGSQAEQASRQAADLQVQADDLAKKASAQEAQELVLAALRNRLERLQEDLDREELALLQQRARQSQIESELQTRTLDLDKQKTDLANQQNSLEAEQAHLEESRSQIDKEAAQVRHQREQLALEQERIRQCSTELDALARQQAEQAPELEARFAELAETQERLQADRQNLRDREAALAQAETARDTLQEQLRRRSAELAERQRGVADKEKELAELSAKLEVGQVETQTRVASVEHLRIELDRREAILNRQVQRLKQTGKALAGARKSWNQQQRDEVIQHREAEAAIALVRAEWESLRQEATELERQLPQWESLAKLTEESLTQARERIQGHLAEISAYVKESQHDLEAWRSQAQAEGEQVRQRGQALQQTREEHRLAVVAFRQQLVDWQSQVAGMRQALSQDQSRLERQQAEVDARARLVDVTSEQLALKAEQLQAQERDVSERRTVMEQHLADMREWYRRKLRELTERFTGRSRHPTLEASEAEPPATPAILTMTPEVAPGDRRLGEVLRELELVDADTLEVLLVEARKQRQSLRQVLLQSGYLTLYQLALIEAGNIDGLVLGPVRVLDRLQASAHETVYRVFDPRRTGEDGYALLRHLAEAEMHDAVHPDEFRQRFGAALAVRHPHVSATREILEINGRPAVLVEWVSGLVATEWPALASAPGVWYRLVSQAALGLATLHEAGLVHGHLHPSLIVLTANGIVKIGGVGEPPWLAGAEVVPAFEGEDGIQSDLAALGLIAAGWAGPTIPRRKSGKRKTLDPLQKILQRLQSESAEDRYASAGALLEDLERLGETIPANPEAWDRLLHFVRENGDDKGLKQSA